MTELNEKNANGSISINTMRRKCLVTHVPVQKLKVCLIWYGRTIIKLMEQIPRKHYIHVTGSQGQDKLIHWSILMLPVLIKIQQGSFTQQLHLTIML